MRMYDIISRKRDGLALSNEEISFVVKGCVSGEIPDYQVSAFLMAVCLRGMTDSEIFSLTYEMAASGSMTDLSQFGLLSGDKHSTGGVGDKTTLIVAPIAASLGCRIAKMSGRGLGHTGGTADKLESIPGYRINMSADEFLSQTEKIFVSVVGSSANLVPADKKLYALRDVTATVESIPLIASSIMSKKLASGAKNIVLDVKTGSGSFMKDKKQATELAEKMVAIGNHHGRNVTAVLTNMDVPLGRTVGNALEVREAMSLLRLDNSSPDLMAVSVRLAAELVSLCRSVPFKQAEALVHDSLRSGAAYAKFSEWITTQGGNMSALESKSYGIAPYGKKVVSTVCGFITSQNTELVGTAAMLLGAGRTTKNEQIDGNAGIIIYKKRGDYVKAGEILAELKTSNKEKLGTAEQVYLSSLVFGGEQPVSKPLIYGCVRNRGDV